MRNSEQRLEWSLNPYLLNVPLIKLNKANQNIKFYFTERSPSTHTMSPWMKKLFLQLMPKLLMMRRTKYSLPDYDDTFVSNGYTNELEMR